jgi:predicted nucleic acid-binding protein
MPDINILTKAGELAELAVGAGGDAGIEDAIIAATGNVNNIVVLTRNVRHLKLMQVEFHNPFDSIPPA